jgi:hypothetical protein
MPIPQISNAINKLRIEKIIPKSLEFCYINGIPMLRAPMPVLNA